MSSSQSTPAQVSEPGPTSTSTATVTSNKSESGSCNFDPACSYKESESTEAETQQAYSQLIAVIAPVAPEGGNEPLTSLVTKEQEAWMTYRDSNCNLERNLAQYGSRAVRGATLNLISAECRTDFNRERTNELLGVLQRFSGSNNSAQNVSSENPNPDLQEESFPSSFLPRRVQDLTADGDYLLSSEEPPFNGGEFILVLRKQGNTTTGFQGFVDSDGHCFKAIIKSASEVETTIFDGMSSQFEVSTDNGTLSPAPLKHYDVEQLYNAAELLSGCEETFS